MGRGATDISPETVLYGRFAASAAAPQGSIDKPFAAAFDPADPGFLNAEYFQDKGFFGSEYWAVKTSSQPPEEWNYSADNNVLFEKSFWKPLLEIEERGELDEQLQSCKLHALGQSCGSEAVLEVEREGSPYGGNLDVVLREVAAIEQLSDDSGQWRFFDFSQIDVDVLFNPLMIYYNSQAPKNERILGAAWCLEG